MASQLPRVIELDREGLYFVANDGEYWVYVNAVDRFVRVFSDMKEAIAYGVHAQPSEITIEVIDRGEKVIGEKNWEIRYRDFTVRVCKVDGECEEYRAWA